MTIRFQHEQVAKRILKLDAIPEEAAQFEHWIDASAHLDLLKPNAKADVFLVFASSERIFVHTVIAPLDDINEATETDLLRWNFNSHGSAASYVTGAGDDHTSVEVGISGTGSHALRNADRLVFSRIFEGLEVPNQRYIELSQEYAHLTDLHWRPEYKAYCRLDKRGDIETSVAVTTREHSQGALDLATFRWEPLEEYMAASDAVLVRMFQFSLFERRGFPGWPTGMEREIVGALPFVYSQFKAAKFGNSIRGVQVVSTRRPRAEARRSIVQGWFGESDDPFVEFIVYDWRNEVVTMVSTDPSTTTNYFECSDNSLPFELSAAFFRPEVLLKYKMDRDKYTVGAREISCRGGWHLEAFDVNEAGQIHAYICYLRNAPYEEQLHWRSFNEEPKHRISDRAIANDFQAQWTNLSTPFEQVLEILRRWYQKPTSWWVQKSESAFERVSAPVTSSQDEWADAFLELTKLVVEGFRTKPLRRVLSERLIDFDEDDRTIALLEKITQNPGCSNDFRLHGLRSLQFLRTKLKGHAGSSDRMLLFTKALEDHGSLPSHFQHVCEGVAADLITIEKSLSDDAVDSLG